MIFVCALLIVALVVQSYFNWREREKLIRRVQEPQQVMIEQAPKRPKPPVISMQDDAAYKRLMESRGQIPVDN